VTLVQMKAYSIDLRQKIVDAYNNQEGSYRQLAQRFRVSFSFVKRLLKRYKDTGKIEPKPHAGGQNSKVEPEQLEIVRQLVEEDNDAILDELCSSFYQKTQLRVSRATMGRIVEKLNLTRKKKRFTPANETQQESKNYDRRFGSYSNKST
jgi:putative transposase